MNERIKELVEQAGITEGVFTRHDGVPCDLKGYSMLPDEMVKFAELIVRECATIASDFIYDWDGDQGIKKVILKEFGVEE